MPKLCGFGSKIIKWIKILYNKSICQVVNNNYLGRFFNIKKGIRQGDPLSPTILLLCIGYLAATVRQSNDYQGFKIERHRFKVLLRMIQ